MKKYISELISTYALVFCGTGAIVINEVSNGKVTHVGIAIGAVVLLEALFAGPITGASMNPARSIGPALVSGQIQSLWLYILAPTLGALFAVLIWKILKK